MVKPKPSRSGSIKDHKTTFLILSSVTLVVILLDIMAKFIVRKGFTFSLSFLSIHYVRNTGVAFGMMQGHNLFFIFFSFVIIALLGYFFYTESTSGHRVRGFLYLICWGLIFGGALGNLIDRILSGFVIDFIDLGFWPAFNLADSSIVVGVILLVLFEIKASGMTSDKRAGSRTR